MSRLTPVVRQILPPAAYLRLRDARWRLARGPAAALESNLGVGRCGGLTIRPLTGGDPEAWAVALRAAHPRMEPWWSFPGDIETLTDAIGFQEHVTTWRGRLREGTGACMGVESRGYFAGELQIWHLHPGSLTCEIGLWLRPDGPSREALGCFAYVLERLIDIGVERIDAPVAVGNDLPRRFLTTVGFEVEATIPKWRELHGQLVDYDLMTLTPSRWAAARDGAKAALGEWGAVSG